MQTLVRMTVKQRYVVGLLAGLVVFGTVFAFAATLNVGSAALSAGNATVSSCQSGTVDTTYSTAYDQATNGYKVNGITVTGLSMPACNGKTVTVTLTGTSSANIGQASKQAESSSTLTFSASDLNAQPAASQVTGVSTVITG